MKEHLISLLSGTPNPLQARNQAREYLQALILAKLAARRRDGSAGLPRRDGAALPV